MSQNEAIRLLDKYLNGDFSEEERQRVEAWLEKINSKNAEWTGLSEEEKKTYIKVLFGDLQKKIAAKSDRKNVFKYKLIYWTAAAVFLLTATYGLLHIIMTRSTKTDTVQSFVSTTTRIGEMKEVVLKDGTQVWLNAVSELRYPSAFEGDTREVYLKGEAFFKVTKDADKPFIVHSGALNTKVLGTSFDIHAYSEDKNIEVTVLSGKVVVNDQKARDKAVVLEKSERANYVKERAVLTKNKVVNMGNELAWKQGELAFYHSSMEEVAKILHRTYGLNIRFKNKVVQQCEISGHFNKKQNPESVLKAICLSIDGQFSLHGKEVSISGPGCE